MNRTTLRVDVITSARDFAAMREEWSELLASSSSDNIFLTWEWMHTWWTHFGSSRRLFLVTVHDEARLIAIAPLTQLRTWVGPIAMPVLEFAGTGTIGSDYLDIIVRRDFEAQAFHALTSFLGENAASIRMPRVSDESGLAKVLAAELGDHGWRTRAVPAEVCPFIALAGKSFEDFLAALGSSHRYNFRRRLRNLTQQHNLQIRYAESDDERRQALAQVIDLHLQRWSTRGGSDAFDREETLAFHDQFSALARENGWLRLLVMHVDGEPAAAFYGFRYGGKFSFYQSGFDPAFHRLSVGLVMIGLTIRDAIAEGAAEYDLLHGDESYKFLWTSTIRQLIRLELYPPGHLGRMHRDAVRVTAATKRLAKRVLL